MDTLNKRILKLRHRISLKKISSFLVRVLFLICAAEAEEQSPLEEEAPQEVLLEP